MKTAKKCLIVNKFIKDNMKNVFTLILVFFSSVPTFSQTSEDVFFDELLKEEKIVEVAKVEKVNKTKEEVIFESFEFGLSLKKFTRPTNETEYVFYFHNDGDVYPGKMMTIDFKNWTEVASFFNNTKRVIEQQKRTTYTFSNQSYKIHWATKHLALIYVGEQYCYISKEQISEMLFNLR